MLSKADFQALYAAAILNYPDLIPRYRAQDPRLLGPLEAHAAMNAAMSQQLDIADYEPYLKTRDATILADATLKGILPLARSNAVTLTVTNNGAESWSLASGRRLTDPKGRLFMANAGLMLAPGESGTVPAVQKTVRAATHTVSPGGPFYRIKVPAATDGTKLCALQVTSASTAYDYRPDYFNVLPGDLAYQAETDEYRNLYVVFGKASVVGHEPVTGDVFTMTIEECEGQITDLETGKAFALEYIYTTADGSIDFTLASVDDQGQNPPDMVELRTIAQYQGLYDHDAVYLGDFNVLLRRYIGGVQFLNAWNEQVEERARGPNVSNVNKLFVSGVVTGMSAPVFQARVRELVRRADDSMPVVFRDEDEIPLPVTIRAKVSVVHDAAEVEAQIRTVTLGQYGRGQALTSRGGINPVNVQYLSGKLTAGVPALKDEISDCKIDVATGFDSPKPEQWLYITQESLTVVVERVLYNSGLWNR